MQSREEILAKYVVSDKEQEHRKTANKFLLQCAELKKKQQKEKLEILLDTVQIHEGLLVRIFADRDEAFRMEKSRLEGIKDMDDRAKKEIWKESEYVIRIDYKLALYVEYERYTRLFHVLQHEYHDFSEETREYFFKNLNDLNSERYARESTLHILENIVWENRKVEACLVCWDKTNTQNKTHYDESSCQLSILDLSDETAARLNLRRYDN